MLTQLCRARIWTLPTDDHRGTIKEKTIQKIEIRQNQKTETRQIEPKGNDTKDEALTLHKCDVSYQVTDNPCYGLTIRTGEKHVQAMVQSNHTDEIAIPESHQEHNLPKDNESAVFKTVENDSRKTSNQGQTKAFSVNSTQSASESISGCQTRSVVAKTNRICKGCHKGRGESFLNQQQKALEDVVNMFDHHLNLALSRQRKKQSCNDRKKNSGSLRSQNPPRLKQKYIGYPTQKGISIKQCSVEMLKNSAKNDILYSRSVSSAKDIEKQLDAAYKERPANIPMVVMQCSRLRSHIRNKAPLQESSLSMGSLVYALFREEDWLYVRTPHGREGYIHQTCCVSMASVAQNQRALKEHQMSGEDNPNIRTKPVCEEQFGAVKGSKKILYNVLADVNPSCFGSVDRHRRGAVYTQQHKKLDVSYNDTCDSQNIPTVKKILTNTTDLRDFSDWHSAQSNTLGTHFVTKTAPNDLSKCFI